ncbi:CRISPR-associated RAMP protein Csx10 [Candidatus Poribacteria bacterium]|nr:CRISPR-associated RAMP protein Csx10 [Candidatus Poribacteria bacterium]
MARKISLPLNALSPIHISSRKYLVFNETYDFIPATTLRGTLASIVCENENKWQCEECGKRGSCNFEQIFNNKRVRFRNLYPVASDLYEKSFVLPATAVSCKRCPGFLSEFYYELSQGKRDFCDEVPHGVFDLLIPSLAYQIMGRYDYEFKCPEAGCNSKLEPFSCFYSIDSNDISLEISDDIIYDKVLINADVTKRRLVRAAINRERRTTQENLLFSLEAIEEGNQFFGEINIEDDGLASIVKEYLDNIESRRLGGIRSRGFGSFEFYPDISSEFDTEVKKRILAFNHHLEVYLKNLNGFDKQGIYFTLGLQSDAILKNRNGEYSVLIDEDILSEHLNAFISKLNITGLKLVKWSTSQSNSLGWSGTWKMPKAIESAIKSGSIFVFKVDELNDDLIKGLEELQMWGIGEKCEEGFGDVIICDEFHYGFHEIDQCYNDKWRY